MPNILNELFTFRDQQNVEATRAQKHGKYFDGISDILGFRTGDKTDKNDNKIANGDCGDATQKKLGEIFVFTKYFCITLNIS